MKEKFFNYRPIALVFAFLLLGSLFSFYILNKTIVTIIIFSIVLSGLVVWSVLKKNIKYILISFTAFVFAVGIYYFSVWRFNRKTDVVPNTIEARIYDITNEQNGLIKTECDSCLFDSKKTNENLILYIYDNTGVFENVEVGSVIKFSPHKFYKSDMFYNELPNSNLYVNDLKYTASVEIDSIEYLKSNKTISEKFKERIENNLKISLSTENAEIAYSALFGDKDLLSEKQYSNYKHSGIAHLLAVSGLHVGIVFAILSVVLGFFNVKGWWKIGAIATFLLLYAILCGFSISIIRASIMCLILLVAKQVRRDYDPLNALSLAGIVTFLMNPFCIFDVGFLLSFYCVAGIIMLTPTIKKWIEKSKQIVPSAIVDALAISISITISIIFVNAYFFQNLNIVSIIANIIIIPLFTVAFVCVFIISLISLICSYVCHILMPLNYLLDFINILAKFFGSLSFSNFGTTHFNYISIIIYFILLFSMSRFCVVKYKYKIATTLPMVALLFYCLL